jgi:PAS domain S-box-containing protein
LVDSETKEGAVLGTLLTDHGYEVQTVTSGQAAFEAVNGSLPNLIVLGIPLPDMDGLDVCERLQADERTRNTPVLFVIPDGEPEIRSKAFAARGADCVTRPLQGEEVLACVRGLLTVPAVQEQLEERNAPLARGQAGSERDAGESREMRTRSQPIIEGGEMSHLCGMPADATGGRHVPDSELLSAILDTVGALVVVLDTQGRIVGFNQACERTTGYSEEEVVGQCLWDLLLIPEEVEPVSGVFSELRAGTFPNEHENLWVTREGDRRLIAWSNTALLDDDGEVAYVIGTGIDITEHRQAEEALRQREEAWRSLTEYSPDHIMLLDRDANILFINHTIQGLSREQVIGTSFYDYALETYREPAQRCFERVLRTGQPDRFESVYVDANRDRRTFETHVGPVIRSGQVWELTARSTDITDRKEAERALEELSYELGERVKELNCLLGVSTLVSEPGITLVEILQGTVGLLPPAWQYPEIACARVILDGREFATENFRESAWRQARDIWVHGRQAGRVEVCYLEERPESREGPFLEEEGELLNAIAGHLGRIAERLRAEEEIERLARFPSENPNPVLRIAQDGSILYANQASSPLLHCWGCQVGQPLPDEWREFSLGALHAGLGKDAEAEVGDRTFALTFAPVVEHGYVNVYALDITDRKRAQEALRRSEERYALAERAAQVGSWDWDIQTGDLHWSDQIEAMFGFGRGEFGATYEAFLERVHPGDRPDLVDAVNASVEEGADYAIEHRIVWPDGTVRWMSETGDVIRDESGRALRMLGIVRDVTQPKEAEERIRQQNEFLTSVLESVTHPLYVVDVAHHTVVMANSAAFSGSLPEHAKCYALFHGRTRPCAEMGEECPIEEVKRTKKPVTAEHGHRDPAGVVRTTEIRGYPLFDDEGDVTAVIEYCLDVTERKQMERALRAAKDAAEEARREEERRRREAERRRQIAESLTDVVAALNSNQPLDRVLDYIAEQASQLLDTQAVAICRLHGDAETFAVEAARCLPHDPTSGAELLVGIEALVQAVVERQTVAVPDLTAGPTELALGSERPESDVRGVEPFRALLAVPIIVHDEAYGGMVLYYTHPRSFSDEEIELADVFSNQIALAVENARLREEVREAAVSAERSRLARDLHDSVTQALFSASLVAETLPRVWQRDPQEAQKGLEELRDLTRGALAEMRTLLLELRPIALVETRLDDLLQQLTQAVTSRAQIPVAVNVEPSPSLPPDVQVTFYRVAQEALNNAVKHAEASQLSVSLQVSPPASHEQADGWQGRVALRVSDNGRGFDADQTLVDHLGLGIMRERAKAIGSSLTVESQPDQGTEVILSWDSSQP